MELLRPLVLSACVWSAACGTGNDERVSGAADNAASGGDNDAGGGSGGAASGGESTGAAGSGASGGSTGAQADAAMPDCDMSLRLSVRDFTEDHPDFESFDGNSLRGIVKEDLGADKKPVYAGNGPTPVNTGKAEFDQWYRDTPGVNMLIPVDIDFVEESPGVFVYDNSAFFPIDNMGFGNGPDDAEHNFLFTTEAHTLFTYSGGEEFTFRGDDDLWVFINNKLAVDLGGLHGAEMSTISLDAEAARLGITVGQTYSMDIFHAERHTNESNYRIETTIDLSCIQNVPII